MFYYLVCERVEAEPGRIQLTADKESLGLAAPLAIAFVKHLGHLYLPADPATHDFPSLDEGESPMEAEVVSREVKDKFRKLLVAFVEALCRKEGRDHIVGDTLFI